jgi:hypothetical protein
MRSILISTTFATNWQILSKNYRKRNEGRENEFVCVCVWIVCIWVCCVCIVWVCVWISIRVWNFHNIYVR